MGAVPVLGASDDGTELRGAQEGRVPPRGHGVWVFPTPQGSYTVGVCRGTPWLCLHHEHPLLLQEDPANISPPGDHLLPGAEGRMLCHLFLLCFLSIMSFACTMSLSSWHQRQTHLFGGSSSVGTGWTCAHPPCSTLACPCSGEEGRCTTRGR